MKIIFLRERDYWLFPANFFCVLFMGIAIYVGVLRMQVLTGAIGLTILGFTTYIVRKHYGNRRALQHLALCLILACILALVAYLLTD